MLESSKTKVIGVGGYARSGKDTFVKISRKILHLNGYTTSIHSFAAGLKDDLDPWLIDKYGISAWTENDEEKKLIRPFMVAHGCGKRIQTEGKYWVDKVDGQIRDKITHNEEVDSKHVFFISDVRFPNEAKWLHESWNGYLVHLKKFSYGDVRDGYGDTVTGKIFDQAPNEEELKQDPEVVKRADYKLELENVLEREKRLGNIITTESLVDNSYLTDEITKCLAHCPFLNIQIESRLLCS